MLYTITTDFSTIKNGTPQLAECLEGVWEMQMLTASYQQDKLEYLKNPVAAEFPGLSSNIDMTEIQLESFMSCLHR